MATATEIVDETRAFAVSSYNDMRSFINVLADAVNVFYENVVGDIEPAHVPVNVVTAMFDDIAGLFPTIPEIVIPNYSVPSVPEISFTEILHNIDPLEAARAKLLTDLEDGSYGIDTGDEAQLLDRMRDRANAEAVAAQEETDRAFQSRGFSLPPGTMFGALERVMEGRRETVNVANRDIYVQRAAQFVQARQFAIQTAGVADRTRADILEIQFRIEEARARYTLALFQTQLDHFRIQIQSELDKATLTVRIFEAHASVANARARASADAAKVFIAEYQANTQAFLGVMEVRLRNAQNQLDAAKSNTDVRLTAATAGAEFYKQVVAAALGAVNTMVSQAGEDA